MYIIRKIIARSSFGDFCYDPPILKEIVAILAYSSKLID
jgi:hypothetical protein